MRALFAALGFLTIAPVPQRCLGSSADLSRSVAFFPLVGVLLGVAAAALDAAVSRCVPPTVAAVLVVSGLIAVSGGLHVDGLADTADGFLSARPRARILEIMKDPRTGPMGVMAVVCVLALKFACMSAIAEPSRRFAALLMAPLAGRCAIVVAMSYLPYARPEGGTGAAFVGRRSWAACALGLAAPPIVGFAAARGAGIAAAAGGLAAALVMSLWSWRKLRGWTGDTLGATCELAEALALVGFVAFRGA